MYQWTAAWCALIYLKWNQLGRLQQHGTVTVINHMKKNPAIKNTQGHWGYTESSVALTTCIPNSDQVAVTISSSLSLDEEEITG